MPAFSPVAHKVPLLETKSQIFQPADLWALSLCLPKCFTTPLEKSVTNRTRADDMADVCLVQGAGFKEHVFPEGRLPTSFRCFCCAA